MRRVAIVAGLIIGLSLMPGVSALAQDLPDLPGMGGAQTAIDESGSQGVRGPRTPRAPRQPGEVAPALRGGARGSGLPGSDVLPKAERGGRRDDSKARSGLPRTGQNFVLMWVAAFGLVATGVLLFVVRRRLRASAQT